MIFVSWFCNSVITSVMSPQKTLVPAKARTNATGLLAISTTSAPESPACAKLADVPVGTISTSFVNATSAVALIAVFAAVALGTPATGLPVNGKLIVSGGLLVVTLIACTVPNVWPVVRPYFWTLSDNEATTRFGVGTP